MRRRVSGADRGRELVFYLTAGPRVLLFAYGEARRLVDILEAARAH
ncbi:hypothetical protein ACFSTC_18985 [Nonomuraea ferruginea]